MSSLGLVICDVALPVVREGSIEESQQRVRIGGESADAVSMVHRTEEECDNPVRTVALYARGSRTMAVVPDT